MINPDDHRAKVVLCGALLISPMFMMSAVNIYNRIRAKTLLANDSILSLLATTMTLATYATFVHAKNLGFGKHTIALGEPQLHAIRNTILTAILILFVAQAFAAFVYNSMARKTARSQKFARIINAFSAGIAVWALANIAVIIVSLANKAYPPYTFFVTSPILTLCITIMQLAAFMWIVWNTSACLSVEIRWSVSLGLFVPILTATIILRLVTLPTNIFTNDWTFALVPTILLFLLEVFLLEVFLSVMNLLAPSLPVFFDQTSTGGLYFRPDDNPRTTTYSSSAQRSRTAASQPSTRTRNTMINTAKDGDEAVELVQMVNGFSASVGKERDLRRASFDSDAVLVRSRLRSIAMGA